MGQIKTVLKVLKVFAQHHRTDDTERRFEMNKIHFGFMPVAQREVELLEVRESKINLESNFHLDKLDNY